MFAQIVSPVGTVCSLKEDSIRGIEEFASSQQTCKPFSVSDGNPSKSSVAHDLSTPEILSCTLNSISLAEISEESKDGETDHVRLDDTVQMKFNDIVHLSPPKRNARVTESNQKNASKRAGRKQLVINEMIDSILSSVARKTRSYECRRARSSVWGSVGLLKYLENRSSKVIKNGIKKSKKTRGAQGSTEEKNNGVVTGLEVSNGNNTRASFGRNPFKVKPGKKKGQPCLKDMISVAGNGPQFIESTDTEARNIPNFSGYNSKEEVHEVSGTQCCNGDLEKVVMPSECLDICSNKELESSVTGERSDAFVANNHQGIPSLVDIEGSGVSVNNKYGDLGTSPDSEVINLISEAQLNGKEQVDCHDVRMSSRTCVTPADILSLSDSSSRDLNVQDRLDTPGLLDKASVAERFGQGQKHGNGLYFSGVPILTNTVNLSDHTASSEGSPGELLLSSKVSDRGSIFPCMKKSKGQKHLKNSISKQGSKIGSEVFESPRNKKEIGCKTKRDVKSVRNEKLKNKTACGEFARTIKDYHETGYDSLDVLEIDKTGDGNVAQGKIDVGIAHMDVPDQCILPHNAWVCCDVCFKWRRISAILADSINETSRRWTCNENVDKDFADCLIPQEKSNSEINAELDISDAEEDVFHDGFSPKRSLLNPVEGDKQSSWRLIKSNMFMHRCRKSQSIDEIMVCHCKPPTNGKLGCGAECLNRMLNIECVKGTCPCGEHCSNQQFQKRKYTKLKWFRCGKKGYGLQLLEDISEGQFLIEYVGEVLDMQAYEARQKDYASKGHKHFYFMTLNGSEVIDACAKGNLGRFINHSCDPNCRTEKWMVNGEVSVGFFALKDLKKGDEVTFDYNYVRVFGAAAKKCMCGSSQCQGYIGGDPRDSNIIVQGDSDDEFPEPVMIYDNGEVDDSLKRLISSTCSLDDAKASSDNAKQALIYEDKLERSETGVGHLESKKEPGLGDVVANVDKTDESEDDVHYLEQNCRDSETEKLPISFRVMEKSTEELQPAFQKLKSSSQQDINSLSTIFIPCQVNISSPEASALTVVKKKSEKRSGDTIKNLKSDKLGDTHAPKLRKLMKTSHLTASVEKGKSSNSSSVSLSKPEKIVNKSHGLSDKPKKIIEGSATVEETLNELLDDKGGISKRQDATKGYLKLLLLTAASGDSGRGETIQSNRELSMILGAILKTQSRSVLVDVINKNGLQMLHNMLKRCRRDFSRIPILRKLLRVLEFLATKEILTKDLINKDPSCVGVESFRESILSLAEHDDKQVHQIARNFRKKWIPWSLRRRLSSQNHRQDPQTRDSVNNYLQTVHTTLSGSNDTVMKESCSTQSRKRKSRWDQPADSNKEPKLQPIVNHMNAIGKENHLETRADDAIANTDEDMPPGFPCRVDIGHSQKKITNRLGISYGIPLPIVHQLGYTETDSLENWCIAPGIPFQPYPPLPVYSRNRSDIRDHRCNYQPVTSQSDCNPPSTSGSVLYNAEIQGTNNRCNVQQSRVSQGMGRYFRQQKWNNSRLPPPWKRQQNGRGFMGNNFRNSVPGGRNGSQGGNNMEIDSHYFTQNPHQGTYY